MTSIEGLSEMAFTVDMRLCSYLANSTRASVTEGVKFFFTMKMFRGGAGHWSERRSPSCDSKVTAGVSAYSRYGTRRLASSHRNVTSLETHLDIRAISAGVGTRYL